MTHYAYLLRNRMFSCDVTVTSRDIWMNESATNSFIVSMASSSSMANSKRSSGYGRYCVAGTFDGNSCKNTQFTEGVSFHCFPDKAVDRTRHQQWVRFVRRHRQGFTPSKYSALCSIHFEETCYTMRRDLAKELGIRTKLKADAVPSIDIANERADSGTTFRERKQVRPK